MSSDSVRALQDKVVLITGASEGLGAAFARAAADAGARVVVTARRKQLLDELAETITSGPMRWLVMSPTRATENASWQSALAAYGRVDVLVNNAAVAAAGPASDQSLATVEDTVAANLTAVMRLCQLIAPDMFARGSGSTAYVSSISALRSFDRFGLFVVRRQQGRRPGPNP